MRHDRIINFRPVSVVCTNYKILGDDMKKDIYLVTDSMEDNSGRVRKVGATSLHNAIRKYYHDNCLGNGRILVYGMLACGLPIVCTFDVNPHYHRTGMGLIINEVT